VLAPKKGAHNKIGSSPYEVLCQYTHWIVLPNKLDWFHVWYNDDIDITVIITSESD